MTDAPVKGPASYFPSIEEKCGRPFADWRQIVRDAYPARIIVFNMEGDMDFANSPASVAN